MGGTGRCRRQSSSSAAASLGPPGLPDADVGHTRHEADACRIAPQVRSLKTSTTVGRERHALRRQGAPGLAQRSSVMRDQLIHEVEGAQNFLQPGHVGRPVLAW